MLLLTGPPGSGKTHHVITRVREALKQGHSDFRLLVPTATMAEHLRNQMAREGYVFRPSVVGTLSKFAESWVEDLPQVSSPSLDLILARVVDRLSLSEFAGVAEYPGFRTLLSSLLEECSSSGCDSQRLGLAIGDCSGNTSPASAFQVVFEAVERELEQRGIALRGERLRQAAKRIRAEGLPGIRNIFLDGFFSLADPEIELVDALHRYTNVTVTLPSWQGSEAARRRLLAVGFSEKRCERIRPQPRVIVLKAPTLDQEVTEIARRVLDHVTTGRQFREIGIVLRTHDPYVPALRTTLERFGIPSRFYFGSSLSAHSLVRYLSGAIDAMLGGWDHEQTLRVLKMTASGLGERAMMDRFDFRVREALPGKGLERLREMAEDRKLRVVLDMLGRIDAWRNGTATPANWAQRFQHLAALFRPPRPADSSSHQMTALWRGQVAAIGAFQAAVDEAWQVLEQDREMALPDFWGEVKAVLRLSSLRIPDYRRNVVHVLDVYEARQWELPVIFVCGLLEKQFPLYHAQNPILPDDLRRRVQNYGLRLRTAADRDQEEQFLFEMATTRATTSLILSYPQFNEKGDENLKSFYLEKFIEGASQKEEAEVLTARPQPVRSRPPARIPIVYDAGLLEVLHSRHTTLSPTAIECFLQCPFQFFAGYTLHLQSPPPKPNERLDAQVQGNIIHQVLAEWCTNKQPVEPLFERVFQDVCEEHRIAPGYRTEAVRLELLRNLQRFVKEPAFPGSWSIFTEREFIFNLEDGLSISGRIDRLDVTLGEKALVIDYKYSRPEKIRERVKAHREGKFVQGGLYMLAVEQVLSHEIAGMLYAGLRKEVTWDGWHIPLPGLERIGEALVPEDLYKLLVQAAQTSLRAAAAIREGRIMPEPADPKLCPYCDFCDICRIEIAAHVMSAGRVEV